MQEISQHDWKIVDSDQLINSMWVSLEPVTPSISSQTLYHRAMKNNSDITPSYSDSFF